MKKSHIFILLTGFILGLLAVCWSRGQTPSQTIKVMTNGVEMHTLMLDENNAMVEYLGAAGQTNALKLFRQYQCAYSADLSTSELEDTLRILKYLREGQKDQAIYNLEQHLSQYASLLCNSYGGLNTTNRERVNVEPLAQARDYLVMYPHPEWGTNTARAVNAVLRMAGEQPKK